MKHNKRIILFTDSFPYGMGETFLAQELPYLSKYFEEIIIYPLTGKGIIRDFLSSTDKECNIIVEEPLLDFDLKDRKKLLVNGFLNFEPIFFSVGEFFKKKVFLSRTKIWIFFTALLMVRSILSRRSKMKKLHSQIDQVQVLYFYWGYRAVLILPFLRKAIDRFPKTIVRFHGSDLYEQATGYLPFRRNLFEAIDIVSPISEKGAIYLLERYKSVIKDLKVFRLGSVGADSSSPIRDKNTFSIVTCSNIVELKRLDKVVDALKLISKEDIEKTPYKKICWTHIGDGPLMDVLKKQVPEITSGVEVDFKGALSYTDVMAFYASHYVDLFLNTSRSEGVPVSIMEALSFGVPVFATNVGGVSEIISDNIGLLMSVDITPALLKSNIIEFMLKSGSEVESIRNLALLEWKENWNQENNYSDFAHFISS